MWLRKLSYNRFVERQAKVWLHLLFLQTYALGKCTADRGYISQELFEILLLKTTPRHQAQEEHEERLYEPARQYTA